MPQRFKATLLDKVFGSLVSAAVAAVIAGVVAGLGALAATAGLLIVVATSVGVFGIVAIAGTALVLFYRRGRNAYVSYPTIEFHVRVRSKHITYIISDAGLLNYSRTLELEALADNVDRYTDKFMWTGGDSGTPTPGENVQETRSLTKAGIWTYYDIMFESALRKGEKVKVTTHWPPLDNWRSSGPFVSTSAEEKTDEIKFLVRVPEKFRNNSRVIMDEMRSIESPYPFITHSDYSFDGDEFSTNFRPQPYMHYRIRWSWSGADAAVTIDEAVADAGQTDREVAQ